MQYLLRETQVAMCVTYMHRHYLSWRIINHKVTIQYDQEDFLWIGMISFQISLCCYV